MSHSKLSSLLFFSPPMTLVALVSISLFLFSSVKTTTLTQAQCLPNLYDVLIQLKQDFNITEPYSCYAGSICWDGIICDEQTGMVTKINLAFKSISGKIPEEIWKFKSLNVLDLSQNEFSGKIPEEIGKLKSLNVLDLSHNVLTGPIPSELANLKHLQILDLSFNQLSEHIPQELTSLTSLFSLNVSYNNLVGEIPEACLFSTSSYLGNPGLCGSPLSRQCATMSSTDIIGLSISIGVGLYVGFASVIWALLLWHNGREWFCFIVDKFYFRYFC